MNKHLKKLNDSSNWQNRKESCEKLTSYLVNLRKENTNAKITSHLIHDFFGTVKSRISDPNKQLIKNFITLVGEIFLALHEKEAKLQCKSFVQELISSFSDKN